MLKIKEKNLIRISLTSGAIRNGYINIPGDCAIFPQKYYGGEPKDDFAPNKFILNLPNDQPISTDIRVKNRNPLLAGRIRTRLGKYFKDQKLIEGMSLIIVYIADGEYQLKIMDEIPGHTEEIQSVKGTTSSKVFSEDVRAVDEVTLREIKTRRGQDKFRKLLLKAFNNTCCITGSIIISVLEAAHIISHSDETNYKVTNGLLLRADIHTLFDLNLIGIDQHGMVHISNELKKSEYGEYQGAVIASSLPENTVENLKKRFVEYSEKNGLN